MDSKTQWRVFLGVGVGVLLIIPIITLIIYPAGNFANIIIRLAALWGMIGLCLTSILNMNKKVLYQKFGLKFLQYHHYLAIFSMILATLHPVVFAINVMNAAVFLPDFSSWIRFWELAGRPALILIYIGLIATLFRKKSKKVWKYIHYFMYIGIIFIYIHAMLIGTDFESIVIRILYSILVAITIGTFIYLRIKPILQKKKKSS